MTRSALAPALRWLRSHHHVPHPRAHLVCLPHAGGTVSEYRDWPRGLPADVAVHAVQYPGRQDRIAEPPATTMAELVDPLSDALDDLAATGLVVFGHSMGACVAYEVTRELERRHGPGAVDRLVVSGSRAPHQPAAQQSHRLADDALIEEIRRVNAGFDALLDAPELVELLLPTIRADYRLIETYLRDPAPRVAAPVSAFGGRQDLDVPAADLRTWAEVTDGPFDHRLFPGGHFYLEEPDALLGALADGLAAGAAGARR